MLKAILNVIIGISAILAWIYLYTQDWKIALALAIIFWANNIYALNKRD
jgi:hypothetical protein